MEKFWAEEKKTIITTAVVAIVALLVIKFFDVILIGGFFVAIAIAGVLAWRYIEAHGGIEEFFTDND